MKTIKGRPSKYKPEFCQQMYELMQQGALDCEICSELKISKDTFYRWLNENPEFKETHDQGLNECEAWWTKRMRERFLKGDDKGFKYCIAIMNNKFAWEKGSKSGDGATTNINISNMNVLQHKSRESLLDFIKPLIEKHANTLDVQLIEEDPSKSE